MTADARNPFYLLLLVASVAFAVTAVAYAFPLRMLPEWFQAHGWKLLLVEVAAVLAFGLASMALDRARQVQKQESGMRNPESGADEPSSTPRQETLGG
jgi:hypothetical protein